MYVANQIGQTLIPTESNVPLPLRGLQTSRLHTCVHQESCFSLLYDQASRGDPNKSLLADMLLSAVSSTGDESEDDYPCNTGDSLSVKQSRLMKVALAEQQQIAEEQRFFREEPHTICIQLPQDDSLFMIQ